MEDTLILILLDICRRANRIRSMLMGFDGFDPLGYWSLNGPQISKGPLANPIYIYRGGGRWKANHLWLSYSPFSIYVLRFVIIHEVLVYTSTNHTCGYLGGAAFGAQGRTTHEGISRREQLHYLYPQRIHLHWDGSATSANLVVIP